MALKGDQYVEVCTYKEINRKKRRKWEMSYARGMKKSEIKIKWKKIREISKT